VIPTGGSSTATLPLPLAAFVSLTLTYKASERFLSLVTPALESLAAGCLWPCMPIVASLWTQKAKRWSDYFVFSASRTVFLQNHNAVFKLLQSCFTATLGLNATPILSNGGAGVLLGHGLKSHSWDGSPGAPGVLFLHVYRYFKGTILIAENIISLLMDSVRAIASRGLEEVEDNQEYHEIWRGFTCCSIAAGESSGFPWGFFSMVMRRLRSGSVIV